MGISKSYLGILLASHLENLQASLLENHPAFHLENLQGKRLKLSNKKNSHVHKQINMTYLGSKNFSPFILNGCNRSSNNPLSLPSLTRSKTQTITGKQ